MKVYIGGDSYCYSRGPSTWPYVFADRLNAKLEGVGCAGRGFWKTRLHLTEYLYHKNDADLYVFCHTDPNRMISSKYTGGIHSAFDADSEIPPNNKEIIKMYNTYLYDQELQNWAMQQWFSELNKILNQKPVIHLFINPPTKRLSEKLNGYKLESTLFFHTHNAGREARDPNPLTNTSLINHFTIDYNIKFGNALADYYVNEVSLNPTQTKYFDLNIV
jgi:hypothetical protein